MNWPVLILCGIAGIVLIIFLVSRNIKDEKAFGDKIKNDYKKPSNEEGDIEIDEVMK